jgi:hypothetical protein
VETIAVSKIVDKIRKLLALSRSENVNEAALAAERAHRLMLEHRLTLSDVTDALSEGVVEDDICDGRMMSIWRFGLLTTCARSYYCTTVRIEEDLTTGRTRVIAAILGRKDDVEAVRCLFEHFEREIEHLASEKFDTGRTPGHFTIANEESWKRGAVVAIQEKLLKQRMMFERETPRAMVQGDKARAAVAEYVEKKYPRTYKPEMSSSTNLPSYYAGYRTGLDVDVPQQELGKIAARKENE